jgi:hypothetical protein
MCQHSHFNKFGGDKINIFIQMDLNFHKLIIIGSAHADVLWDYMWFWAFVFNHILKLLKRLVSRHHFGWK